MGGVSACAEGEGVLSVLREFGSTAIKTEVRHPLSRLSQPESAEAAEMGTP